MHSRITFAAPLQDVVLCFNDEAFWDSHAVLEEARRDQRSEFYAGLNSFASTPSKGGGNPRASVGI